MNPYDSLSPEQQRTVMWQLLLLHVGDVRRMAEHGPNYDEHDSEQVKAFCKVLLSELSDRAKGTVEW